MHNRPSRSHGLDVASTRTRSCELIVKLHWRTIPRLVKPKLTETGPRLDWHMIAWSVFGMLGIFEIAFKKMVMQWSMTTKNADGILTGYVTVDAFWNADQGVSA